MRRFFSKIVWCLFGLFTCCALIIIFMLFYRNEAYQKYSNNSFSNYCVYFQLNNIDDSKQITDLCMGLPEGSTLYILLEENIWAGYGVEYHSLPIVNGTAFLSDEAIDGYNPLCILGYVYSSQNTVGATVRINGLEYAIMGIMNTTFEEDPINRAAILNIGSVPCDLLNGGDYVLDAKNSTLFMRSLESLQRGLSRKGISYTQINVEEQDYSRLFEHNPAIKIYILATVLYALLCSVLALSLQQANIKTQIKICNVIGCTTRHTFKKLFKPYVLSYIIIYLIAVCYVITIPANMSMLQLFYITFSWGAVLITCSLYLLVQCKRYEVRV